MAAIAAASQVAVVARAGAGASTSRRAQASTSSSSAFAGRSLAPAAAPKAARASAARAQVILAAADGKKTIVDVAVGNPDFSILVEAVTKAGLAGALSGPGPFTVFAPTNDAFVKALGALGATKAQLLARPDLAAILKYHVVSGKVMSTSLSNGLEAATLEGSKLKFDLTNGVKVSGAKVVAADVAADNGVIHVIDTVLLPPLKPAAYIAAQAGVSAPFGFFDPLNFLGEKSVTEIKRYQESEIVHGRVAMLAALGFIVGEVFNPLFGGKITGLAVNHFQQVPAPFWEIIVAAIGIAETYRAAKGWVSPGDGLFELRANYAPGDLGFDPLGLKPTSAAELKDVATKEINNGRLAMLAIVGMIVQEELFGGKILESYPFSQ